MIDAAYPVSTSPLDPDPAVYEQRGSAKHARKPLTKLDERALRLVELTIWGTSDEQECAKVGVEPGTPLSIEQAADIVGLRRRNARFIATQRLFREAVATELDAFRTGMKGKALRRIAELVDEKGENSAADRTVQLKAAQSLLGEGSGGVSVNVGVGVGVQSGGGSDDVPLRAGVIIRLGSRAPQAPIEREQQEPPARSPYPLRRSPDDLQLRALPPLDDDTDPGAA